MQRVRDEPEVGVGLRVVAERPPGGRVDLFGDQAGRSGEIDVGTEELTSRAEVADLYLGVDQP